MILCGVAACGGGGGANFVAKVGSQPITKKQLQAVLAKAATQYLGLDFPARGTAEYRLVQEQAIDFLVQQSLARQADAKLGIKPEDRVVTHASWLKVVGGIRVSDAQVDAVFRKNPKRYKPGPNRTLDLGTATEIRTELLRKERGAAMHRFVTDVERRWPVTYAPAYRPVSEMALARKVWTTGPKERCDLPPGSYEYAKARAHGCLSNVPIPGMGAPACSLLGPEGDNGFTSAEVHDGYADYLGDNGGTCMPDPRVEAVQVEPQPSNTPTPEPAKVSYLHAAGAATFRDTSTGLVLRYPRRLHLQQVSFGGVVAVEGVEIANYQLKTTTPNQPLSDGAVDFLFTQGGGRGALPGSLPVTSETKVPIKLTDADLAAGQYTTNVAADGLTFTLTIRTGGSPSRQDVAALKAIAASIHFPPLRPGQFSPSRLYVLGPASKYPLGSVTEIPAGFRLPYYRKLRSGRFYLEHAADGFWTITWPSNYLHGYKACGPHFDAASRRFTCPSGAVWDIKGKVVKNPDPAKHPDDPLERTQAAVADGYVLVSLEPPPR